MQKNSRRSGPGDAGSVPDQVARLLRDEIATGRLPAGARLPAEHALCARFGISRPAVREAIAQLKHDGLVSSRRGVGAVVTGSQRAFRIEPELIEDRGELSQIFELRITFETGSAALAAGRHDQSALDEIRKALDDMEKAIGAGGDAVPSDMRFHLAIAEATGNRYFAEFMAFLEGRLRRSIEASRRELAADRARARTVHAEHQAILRAIAVRDGERARAAMLVHLSNAAEELGLVPALAPPA